MATIYEQVVRSHKFRDYPKRARAIQEMTRELTRVFPEAIGLKLIGSTATGTATRDSRDLDYVVIFNEGEVPRDFVKRARNSNLHLKKVTEDVNGYVKSSGELGDFEFVIVPTRHPRGRIENYVDDAFYHPDLIASRARQDHRFNSILAKTFFKKTGAYKQVQGIGCELMTLHFRNFEGMLEELASGRHIRVNFSGVKEEYSANPIIVDYPFLGRRSLVKPLSIEEFVKIGETAEEVLRRPEILL